jgi:low temperature requirement protein LtrA
MTWFQPPQLRIGNGADEEIRHATWLELFYDLVFVVAISQVAHHLSKHLSLTGYLEFVAMFLPLWWAWTGTTMYANRFDVDDIGNRLLTAVQMLGIAAMAVNIHDGFGKGAIGFTLSYVLIRVILVCQYLRVAQYLPAARELCRWYAIGFSIAIAIYLLSMVVPPPLQIGFWVVGLLVDFATPVSAVRLQARLLPHFEHLPERFGLFVIIVLGEAIIAVVNGVSEQEWDLLSVLTAVFGFAIAFSLWWVYFENVGGAALRATVTAGQIRNMHVWLFGHLPLIIGLAGTGVAVEHFILADPTLPIITGDRWLLCGSVALCLLGLAILHHTGVIFRCKVRYRYRLGTAIGLVGLAIGGAPLASWLLMAIVAVLSMGQVMQDLYQGHGAPMPEGVDG